MLKPGGQRQQEGRSIRARHLQNKVFEIRNRGCNHHPQVWKLLILVCLYDQTFVSFRIDDLIKLAPERGEEKSYQQAYADGSLNG